MSQSYNLDEIPLSRNLKRHSPKQQLVSQNTHTPHVDFIVVVFPF